MPSTVYNPVTKLFLELKLLLNIVPPYLPAKTTVWSNVDCSNQKEIYIVKKELVIVKCLLIIFVQNPFMQLIAWSLFQIIHN